MSLAELEIMFPDYHPGDYRFSVASCCGSCIKGEKKTFCVLCHCQKAGIEMFSYGLCPQYKRDTSIKMPLVCRLVNNPLGNGEG
jgi:hypothetical protein